MIRRIVPFSRCVFAVAALAVLLAPSPTPRAEFEQTHTFTGDELLVQNLIGRIEIAGHDGPNFEVVVRAGGSDATAERLRIDAEDGRYGELIIEFPLEESLRYVYPEIRGKTEFRPDGGSWLSELFGGRKKIEVTGHGRGLELWADVTIRVPRDGSLRVQLGAGTIEAGDAEASLQLSSHVGAIEIHDVAGRVVADTGSGKVTIRGVTGDITADTGSGRVTLADCTGDRILVDTGSGRVELDTVDGERLSIDTGSGRVEGHGIGADEMLVDTGSGSVTVQFDRMSQGRFVFDTGSGGIRLELPPDASATIEAETGSGGIDLDLNEGYHVGHLSGEHAQLRVGAGTADVELETGSGGIRISQR